MKRNAEKDLTKGEIKRSRTDQNDEMEEELSPLLALPTETLGRILDYASPETLWSLRFTCKALDSMVSVTKYICSMYTKEGIAHYLYTLSSLKSGSDLKLATILSGKAEGFEINFGKAIKRMKNNHNIDLTLKFLELLPSFKNPKLGSRKNLVFGDQDSKEFLDVEGLEGFEKFKVLDAKGNPRTVIYYVGEEDPFTIFPLRQIIPAMFTGNQAFGPYFFANYVLPYWKDSRIAIPPGKIAFLKKYGHSISPGLQSVFHFVRFVKAIIDKTSVTEGRGYLSATKNGKWATSFGEYGGYVLRVFLETKLYLKFDQMSAIFPSIASYRKLKSHIPPKMAFRITKMWGFDMKSVALSYYKYSGRAFAPLSIHVDCYPHCYLLDDQILSDEEITPLAIISTMSPDQWCENKAPEEWTSRHGDKAIFLNLPKDAQEVAAPENDQDIDLGIQMTFQNFLKQNRIKCWKSPNVDDNGAGNALSIDPVQLMMQANFNLDRNVQQNVNGVPDNQYPTQPNLNLDGNVQRNVNGIFDNRYPTETLTAQFHENEHPSSIYLEGDEFEDFLKNIG